MTKYILLILLFNICFLDSFSQEEIRKRSFELGAFGFIGSSNFNANLDDERVEEFDCCNPTFKSGDGFVWEVGLYLEQPLNKFFALAARPSIRDLGGELVYIEKEVVNVTGVPQNGEFTHTLDFDNISPGLSLLLDFEPIYMFSFSFGARYSLILDIPYKYSERITKPSTAIIRETGTKTRNEQSGNFNDLNPGYLSLEGGISYSFSIDELDRKMITAELFYSHGMTNLLSDLDWKVNIFGFGLAYRFNLTKMKSNSASPLNPKE